MGGNPVLYFLPFVSIKRKELTIEGVTGTPGALPVTPELINNKCYRVVDGSQSQVNIKIGATLFVSPNVSLAVARNTSDQLRRGRRIMCS
jgi:hypothetical protein